MQHSPLRLKNRTCLGRLCPSPLPPFSGRRRPRRRRRGKRSAGPRTWREGRGATYLADLSRADLRADRAAAAIYVCMSIRLRTCVPPPGVQSAPLGAVDGMGAVSLQGASPGPACTLSMACLKKHRMSHDLSSRPLVVGGSAPCFLVCFWACVRVTLYG